MLQLLMIDDDGDSAAEALKVLRTKASEYVGGLLRYLW